MYSIWRGKGCLFNITLGLTKRKFRSLLIQPSGSGKILSLQHQSVSLCLPIAHMVYFYSTTNSNIKVTRNFRPKIPASATRHKYNAVCTTVTPLFLFHYVHKSITFPKTKGCQNQKNTQPWSTLSL